VRWLDRRTVTRLVAVALPTLVLATLAVGVLETNLGVPNASIVYLVAVVLAAIVSGTPGAVATAITAFLLYDFFFTQPLYTLTINDPAEWLSVVLLVFVAIVVGQLAALQRSRADQARAREREAVALFRLSRELATRASTDAVLSTLAEILRTEAGMDRVWIALGPDDAAERIAADTDRSASPAIPRVHSVLQRRPGDEPARWVRVHEGVRRADGGGGREAFRVAITAGRDRLGSIWSTRIGAR
jgi:K+-sensing histidine kinase KdpD